MEGRSETDAAKRAVIALCHAYSVESTSNPSIANDPTRAGLAPGTAVFLTFLPKDSLDQRIATAVKIRRAALVPVPHLAARSIATIDQLEIALRRFVTEAAVEEIFVIGGDIDRPVGPFSSSLDLIKTGLIEKHGIRRVGIAGYPEGHPRISREVLDNELVAKVVELQCQGLLPFIVTQFAFESAPIRAWLEWARTRVPEVPIRIGLPGPANITTLVKYATRCGVGASIRALWRDAHWARVLVQAGPEQVIRELAQNRVQDEIAGLHFYTFGGMSKTAAWISAILAGAIAFDPSDKGFLVDH